MTGRPHDEPRDSSLLFVDEVLSEDSVEAGLARGARALTALAGAEVAALILIEGGECVLQAWSPDQATTREHHFAAFRRAADLACGRDLPTGDLEPGTHAIPLVVGGRAVGAACLAGLPSGADPAHDPRVLRFAGVLACLAAAHRESSRTSAMRREYERWFKTLDEQVRVLERERQKFAAIVHQSDAEVFVTNPARMIRWTNSVLASQPPPGPGPGSWIGQGCRAVCSRWSEPDAAPECGECPVALAIDSNEVVHHEFRRMQENEARTLYLSALPIKGPDGRPHEVLVMIQDLSRLEVLRKSEERYRLLFERSAKAIVMADPGTARILMANSMASRMTGHAPDELLGLGLDDLHVARDWPELAPRYARGFAEGNLPAFECRVRTRDGGERLAMVSGTRYDLEGQEVAMLEFEDVTERRTVEEALRAAEERLRTVVANAPVILFAIDHEGVFTLSEGRGLEALGLAPGEVVGRSVDDVYRDQPEILANIARALRGEEFAATVEVAALSFETWYAPLRTPSGAPAGLIGVSTDVSQRRRLEDQLRQALKMEAIGRLAGGVAHDFNNLLAAILGHGELLLRRLDPTHPLHRHAESIQKAATRGALLTRQLLAFSRKEVLAPRVLDLVLVVAEMEEMLRRLIGEHIELVIVLADAPITVLADRGQLEQVILNLTVNARDAMTEGGVLTIEVGSEDLADSEATSGGHGPHALIAVSDNGCGMDAETVTRIFEPFFTTKEQGKGTGLGLSTVYGIVEQAGGRIRVDTEPGRGTTFRVHLPRASGRVGAPGAEAGPAGALRGSETVLLAEDEPAVRAMAREALEANGYHVIGAANGAEALAAAAGYEGTIHLLISDVVMPQMGGGELAQQLLAARPGVRVLFMSGYTDDDVVRQGVTEAASAFLQKPFTLSALARKVREVLDAPAGAEPGARRAA